MLRKILGTTGTRILNAGLTFLILWITTNYLGKEGVGTISLIILDISIILLLSDFIGGSALVYFTSRASLSKLMLISYSWTFIAVALFFILYIVFEILGIKLTSIIASGFELHIIFLALLNALTLNNFNILLGLEKIKAYNIAFSIQVVSLVIILAFNIFIIEKQEVISYVIALYISYALSYIYGLFIILPQLKTRITDEDESTKSLIGRMLHFGSMGQFANIVTLINKRFSFWIINKYVGTGQLGVYSASAQLTEGLRIIGQSISIVQFARIANEKDLNYAAQITVKLMKFTLFLTISALLILIIIPSDVFAWIFSEDFRGIKPVIISLAIGVIAMSASMIFAHYFSGIGKPKFNLYTSLAGLVSTIISTIILVPLYGIVGAGISVSISYTIISLFQLLIFLLKSHTKISEFIPCRQDIRFFREMIKNLRSGK